MFQKPTPTTAVLLFSLSSVITPPKSTFKIKWGIGRQVSIKRWQ